MGTHAMGTHADETERWNREMAVAGKLIAAGGITVRLAGNDSGPGEAVPDRFADLRQAVWAMFPGPEAVADRS